MPKARTAAAKSPQGPDSTRARSADALEHRLRRARVRALIDEPTEGAVAAGTVAVPNTVPAYRVPARVQPLPRVRRRRDLVDLLLRRRAWIAVTALLLGGIVFLNVGVVQQSAELSRLNQRQADLKAQNAQLNLGATGLSSSERIQQAAAGMGYVMPSPAAIHYVQTNPATDGPQALAQLDRPQPSGSASSRASKSKPSASHHP